MYLNYATEVSFSPQGPIPEHADASSPSWHNFKNWIALENGMSQSQPFTKSHFHSLIIVKCFKMRQKHKRARLLFPWNKWAAFKVLMTSYLVLMTVELYYWTFLATKQTQLNTPFLTALRNTEPWLKNTAYKLLKAMRTAQAHIM
jgi:hypothetical protein